jgi:uncharacterized protein YjeT (DUF2065 family)
MDDVFLLAIGLVLVIEGLLPALNPNGYREMMKTLAEKDSVFLRVWGLVSMTAGAALIYFFTT